MNAFLEKIGIRGKFQQNFGAIVTLAFVGCAIFGLPFFRFDYYSAYIDTYNLTNTQMGVFGTVIGVFGIVSYLFGGVVADGMSVRKIITFSPIITGAAGLFHLLPLNFYGLLVIYAIWGVSTTFAFRPACVKAVRLMADDNSQGKAFGFYEGLNSVGAAIVAMVALAIFNWGTSQMGNEVTAMRCAIVFYSVINIVMGCFGWIAVKDDKVKIRSDKVSFKGISQVVKSPVVWIIALIAFCNNVFCLSVYYFIPFTTDVLGAAVAFGALLGVFRKWAGVVGNIGGGYLADRFGASTMMLIAYASVLVCMGVVIALPTVSSVIAVVAVLFVIMLVMFHMNSSLAWTMMTEGAIPVEYSGTAAGLICVAAAIPETFASLMAGRIIDTHPGAAGYHMFFGILTVFVAAGLVVLVIWRLYIRSLRKREEEEGVASGAAMDKQAAKGAVGCLASINMVDEPEAAAEAGKKPVPAKKAKTRANTVDRASAKAAMGCLASINMVDDTEDGSVGSESAGRPQVTYTAPAGRLKRLSAEDDEEKPVDKKAVDAGRSLLGGL